MESVSGCQVCFGDNAKAVWEQQVRLPHFARIVGTSHFSITICGCQQCGQRFVRVFCETVDWVGGNDPQEWHAIPVTDAEAEALVAAGEDGAERAVEKLTPARRILVHSFPADAEGPTDRFASGPLVVPGHD
jgi:hypothetical protein